ncbi:hypothetical protein PR202_gb21369 [Eleusine coracana subsp. coracana]|uniref:Cystatin domain-containing protein n=1 Tax=Eleusine coracana subsp. coracana TaxID=191504 RepID=A0AAV5FD08_ELECO|nr:hypothetical protein PR202_gb21369 [Eleusine coracana subsp. coracana]
MEKNLLVVVVVLAFYVHEASTQVTPVNINDPYIQDLGKWAVAQHVKEAHDGIKFKKVVSGYKGFAIPIGVSYILTIDASNRDGKDTKHKVDITKNDWAGKPVL